MTNCVVVLLMTDVLYCFFYFQADKDCFKGDQVLTLSKYYFPGKINHNIHFLVIMFSLNINL